MPSDPLRFHVRPTLRAPSLMLALEGWNDAGEAASTAARYLAGQLRAAPLAELDPEEFFDFTVRRPQVEVAEGVARRLEWPTSRFVYAAVSAPAIARIAGEPAGPSVPAERDLVICLGIEPHLRWQAWSNHVLRFVHELGIRRAVLLGAYLAEVLYSRPVQVTAVASAPSLLSRLAVEPVRYTGPTGMLGVLGYQLREAGCEVVALWAGLPHYIELAPNARGALALLERALSFLGIGADLDPLRRAARECEQRISAMVSGDPELSEYVRELKRREFVS